MSATPIANHFRDQNDKLTKLNGEATILASGPAQNSARRTGAASGFRI
jgi:hypothetical protein